MTRKLRLVVGFRSEGFRTEFYGRRLLLQMQSQARNRRAG